MDTPYKQVGQMSFHYETPDRLCNILEGLTRTRTRVRIFYGDTKTGKCWNDEHDVIGYIGRTTGIHCPILVYNSRSFGGGLVSSQNILKIMSMDGMTIYKADNFIEPVCAANGQDVTIDGELYAHCDTEKQASNLAAYMCGKRMSK